MSNRYKESSRGFIAGWKDAQRSYPPSVRPDTENNNDPAYNTGYMQAYRLYNSPDYGERLRANEMYERAVGFLARWEDQERRAAQYPNFDQMPGFGPPPMPPFSSSSSSSSSRQDQPPPIPPIPSASYEEQPYEDRPRPKRGPQRLPRPEMPAPSPSRARTPPRTVKMRIPTSTEDSADLAEEIVGMTAAELKARYGNTYEEFKKNVRPAMVKAMLYLHPDKPGASTPRITDLTKRLLAYINSIFDGEKILGSGKPRRIMCHMCGKQKY